MRRWVMGLAAAALLTAIHFFVAALPPETATPLVLLGHLWLLGLLGLLLWLATAVGLALAARLRVDFAAPVEGLPFSVALGLGAVMVGMSWLGLLGLFHPLAVAALLAGLGWLARSWWGAAAGLWQSVAGAVVRSLRGQGVGRFWQVAMGAVVLLLAVAAIPTLAPVDSYDALMYHLPAPATYLEQGRLVPFPHQVQANYPMGFEMLFALGLMLQADRLAQPLHFTTGVLLALALYAFARRFLGREGRLAGLLAVLVLLASPKVTLIAGWAFTDMAFVFFASLGLYAFVAWWRKDDFGWLVLAGLMCGVGLSLKYYGLRPPLALGLALIWHDIRLGRGWRALLRDAATFGGLAWLVALPWYLKNWLWLGNPIYPFYLGGLNWSTFRTEEWARWVATFGRGHDLVDYLLLPVNIWLYPSDFSATPHGYFNLGLLLAVVALALRPPRLLLGLGAYIVAQLYLWAVMMQELRYLLLILPWLSLAAGWALARLFSLAGRRRWLNPLLRVAPLALLLFPLAVHLLVLTPFSKNALPVVLGLESPAAYLRRANFIYRPIEFINKELPPEARVVYLWEGQVYHCRRECLPDPIYDRWGDLVYRYGSLEEILGQLRALGATHLLIDHNDGLKPLLRDRSGAGPRAEHIAAFRAFRQRYLTELYADDIVAIYRIEYP